MVLAECASSIQVDLEELVMYVTLEIFVGVRLVHVSSDYKILVHLLIAIGSAVEIGDLLDWAEVDLLDGLNHIVVPT